MSALDALYVGGAICLACTAILLIMAKFAKPGWEDGEGFHEGDEHADDSNLGI